MLTREFESNHPPHSPKSVGWTKGQSVELFTADTPLVLEAGGVIGPVTVEFETYGKLAPAADNVVLITHPLSADAHVAGWDTEAEKRGWDFRYRKPGWWDTVIGPGKAIDTRRFFVVCSNVLGSCYGTTGPASIDPATGKPYGLTFPIVTVGDWVRVQAALLDHLGVDKLHAVIGGSLGGQQALEWALAFPERVNRCVVLAASPRLSATGLGFNAVGRHTIMTDPDFLHGDYYGKGPGPGNGLAAARMLAHITYLSDDAMHAKFGRRLRGKTKPDFGFNIEYEVESYLSYQGQTFVRRFDANSYLYITRAMDYYDAADWGNGDLTKACERIQANVLLASFSSDWLYPPEEVRSIALALAACGKSASYLDIDSRYGHDAFLVETEQVSRILRAFLN
jgi:homoserine O-acetyltransferase